MKRWMTAVAAGSAVTLLTVAVSGADPAPPTIEHTQSVCVAPGAWPRIEARVRGMRAHVVFHAAGSPDWYSVEMRSVDGVWSATLPRPTKRATAFAYFFLAEGPGGRTRLPEASAFVVGVSDECGSAAMPVGEPGPALLGLVGTAPRHTPDFDTGSVEGFIRRTSVDIPLSLRDWAPPIGRKVRVRTVSPETRRGTILRDGSDSVTLQPDDDPGPVTLTKDRWLEGELQSSDEEAFVLGMRDKGSVRIRRRDIVAFESHKPGSAIMALVGGLVGAMAGRLVTDLACAGIKEVGWERCTLDVMVGGIALGAVGGAAFAGSSEWHPVAVLGTRHVTLAVKPMARGGAVGVRVGL